VADREDSVDETNGQSSADGSGATDVRTSEVPSEPPKSHEDSTAEREGESESSADDLSTQPKSAAPKPVSSSFVLDLVALLVFALGTVWRVIHCIVLHDPRQYVYSDMKMYVDLGKRLSREGYKLRPHDVTHPAGVSQLIAWFNKADESLWRLVQFQTLITLLVPLAVALLGWVVFGRRTAKWALIVSSLYFPFVDYGGYFLAEIHLAFVAPITLACLFGAVKLAGRPRSPRNTALTVIVALIGGLFFSFAMALKMVALPALFGAFGVFVMFTKIAPWKTKLAIAAIVCLAAVPITWKTVERCTQGNDGKFCVGSSKAGADFLLGHYGRIGGITWKDPKHGGVVGFGSPSAVQHGYTEKKEVPFLITDSERNKQEAWKWIRQNPGQSVVLSIEHVFDSFGATFPWPANATKYWGISQAFHYFFVLCLLIPSLILLADVGRSRGILGLLRSLEFAMISPLFGVIVAVAIATGEARYRIPWDTSFILLTIELCRRIKTFRREQTEAT
jgi:4-amino-4-deoxy-L-arabinose transferase-like glycosyltransferase